MIHLRGTTAKGQQMYILGLTAEELGRVAGIPLVVSLRGLEPGDMEFVIISGKDEQAIVDSLAAHSVEVRSDKTNAEGEA